jgi:hypothetical protein
MLPYTKGGHFVPRYASSPTKAQCMYCGQDTETYGFLQGVDPTCCREFMGLVQKKVDHDPVWDAIDWRKVNKQKFQVGRRVPTWVVGKRLTTDRLSASCSDDGFQPGDIIVPDFPVIIKLIECFDPNDLNLTTFEGLRFATVLDGNFWKENREGTIIKWDSQYIDDNIWFLKVEPALTPSDYDKVSWVRHVPGEKFKDPNSTVVGKEYQFAGVNRMSSYMLDYLREFMLPGGAEHQGVKSYIHIMDTTHTPALKYDDPDVLGTNADVGRAKRVMHFLHNCLATNQFGMRTELIDRISREDISAFIAGRNWGTNAFFREPDFMRPSMDETKHHMVQIFSGRLGEFSQLGKITDKMFGKQNIPGEPNDANWMKDNMGTPLGNPNHPLDYNRGQLTSIARSALNFEVYFVNSSGHEQSIVPVGGFRNVNLVRGVGICATKRIIVGANLVLDNSSSSPMHEDRYFDALIFKKKLGREYHAYDNCTSKLSLNTRDPKPYRPSPLSGRRTYNHSQY